MKKLQIFFIILIVLGSIFFFWNNLLDIYYQFSLNLPKIKNIGEFLPSEIEKRISTPFPLRIEEEEPDAYLSRSGVIYWTNIQREKYGLLPLKENVQLNTAAEIKTEDMFENQYFAHTSLSGDGVADLTEGVGYEFIIIGENLAFGNFKDDSTLVQAWMESEGHRENILDANYQEIGVAVKKGIFEGKTAWMAVQHFSLPLSACSQPDEALKNEIEEKQNEIIQLQNTLKILEAEIRTMRPRRGILYNQKVEEYNSLVSEYNVFLEEIETLINSYNSQIKLFDECVSGVR